MQTLIELILYGRETCHLCHDMWAELRVFQAQNPNSARFTVTWVDIQEQLNLQEFYGWRIPVLTDAQANLICEGRLDRHRLQLHLQSFIC